MLGLRFGFQGFKVLGLGLGVWSLGFEGWGLKSCRLWV